MNLRTKLTSVVTLSLLAAAAIPASAFPLGKKKSDNQQEIRKLTPAQNALIDKAIAREKVVVQTLKKRTPLVETYIQNMKPDPIMSQAPESDQHFLARVDFGKVINDSAYAGEKRGEGGGGKFGFFKGSLDYITHLSASLHLTYHDSGFVQQQLQPADVPVLLCARRLPGQRSSGDVRRTADEKGCGRPLCRPYLYRPELGQHRSFHWLLLRWYDGRLRVLPL
jgi:hypothetical protein